MNSRYNMNRSERRKKKIKREFIEEVENEGMPNFIKISLIVIALFAIFYVLTIALTGGFGNKQAAVDNNDDDDNTVTTIQYEEILGGETFNMKNEEYYVMFYNFEGKLAEVYNTIITNYETNNTGVKIYRVDLDKGFNSSYVSDVSNPNATSADDLKVNGPTLIKISNGKNVSYSEGKDAIKAVLK